MARAVTFLTAFAAFALACANAASLVFMDPVSGVSSPDAPKVVVLPSYGETSTSVSFFYKGSKAKATKASSGAFHTSGRVIESVYQEYVNYTVPFVFDKDVGVEGYSFSVEDAAGTVVTIEGRFIVAGITIKEGGKIVSGDDVAGVSVSGSPLTYTYDVKAIGTDGAVADVSGAKITYKELTGPYMKEVESTTLSSDSFVLKLNPYRIGTGRFMINFEIPSISKDGESFETVLNVQQATTPVPPCVVEGGKVKMVNGLVAIPMYNLEKPPRTTAVRSVVLSVGKEQFPMQKSSSRGIPDQTIYFRPTALGSATVTCDGEPAKIVGGGGNLELTGTLPKGAPVALAIDSTSTLPRSSEFDTFTAVISVVDSDPSLLTKKLADNIIAQMCKVLSSKNCVYEDIRKGSALMDVAAYVPKGDTTAGSLLQANLDCEFETAVGEPCKNILIGDMKYISAKAFAAGGVSAASATAGLATWTIVLIAVVGAFAIILLIMLALWAVYRRNAEQSESDYSSSGPLGVPDPSDLLYEQSIVRDIYGRGDFPEGGPSAAAAAERAREADLREEFPRPPSSSNVSRGAATDDASSTYSV